MKIAAVQITSVLDFTHNLKVIRHYLKEAKEQGVEAVFLPECFYSLSDGTLATPHLVDPIKKNEHYLNIQKLAKEAGVYLLGGSAASLIEGKVVNRNYNFAPDGVELTSYDKIHLFSCDLSRHESKKVLDEGKVYSAGNTPKLLTVGEWKIGLSICFDLRFPEMYRRYRDQGANLLTISAAFTVPTGRAHWHTLMRARAIENQCYVVAAAQWGYHNARVQTFGHSLIIDPWGEILADKGEGVGLITAEISEAYLKEVRSRLNVPLDR